MRIAYLEDNPDQALLVTRWLRQAGHECEHYACGAELLAALAAPLPDLLLLDWQLPDATGEEVMAQVRARFAQPPPIVFLTAHDEANDLRRVLDGGAADHLAKPVARADLLARLDAFAPAAVVHEDESRLEFPPYSFDAHARTVSVHDRRVALDAAEFDVALCLFRHQGRTVTVQSLAERVAQSGGAQASAGEVQAWVARARAKLRLSAASGWQLRTVGGSGFRLEKVR